MVKTLNFACISDTHGQITFADTTAGGVMVKSEVKVEPIDMDEEPVPVFFEGVTAKSEADDETPVTETVWVKQETEVDADISAADRLSHSADGVLVKQEIEVDADISVADRLPHSADGVLVKCEDKVKLEVSKQHFAWISAAH